MLKSGQRSPFFVDLGRVCTSSGLARVGEELAGLLHREFEQVDILFGPAYKGIVLAAVTSLAYKKKYEQELGILYDRKETKRHGETGDFVGVRPDQSDVVVIVDDVVSSGGTKLEAWEKLSRSFSVTPAGVVVVVDRIRKCELALRNELGIRSVVSLDDIIDYLSWKSDRRAQALRAFYEGEE